MNIPLKMQIVDYISRKDPNHEIVKISPNTNYEGGTIIYNKNNLIIHRNISELKDEEYVRAYLVVKLVRELKYPISSIELEKEYEAGRPKKIKPRIDIIVKDKRQSNKERTFLFIEVKAPDKYESDRNYIEGQLFKLAALEDKESPVQYLVYYSASNDTENIADQILIINFITYPRFQSWIDTGKISLDSVPTEYGIASKLVYVNKKKEDLKTVEKNLDRKVTREKFNYLRNDLHNVLWGGGGMSDTDVFSNLVKLFLAKIFDEYTTQYGKPYTFQIEFKDDKPESNDEIYIKINNLFKRAQKEFLGYSDIVLKNSVGIDQEKISQGKVAYVVEQLQGISLLENENKNNGDLLGEFFEGIVSVGFKQTKGQFFTHTNIVLFILHALNLEQFATDLINGKENPVKPRLPYICDPACGSGTFLIMSMKLLTKLVSQGNKIANSKKTVEFIASNLPALTPNIWAKEYLYGCEINPDLGLATKVNMVLHGDGNMNIFVGDAQGNGLNPFDKYQIPHKISMLSTNTIRDNFSYDKPINENFDIVISNPPFSIDKKALPPSEQLMKSFLFYDKPNSENLFIERWYQILKPNGRLGVVLPESVFDTTENMYIRSFIYKYFKIKAIVSLPQLTFQPHTPTKTALLFAQKKTPEEVIAYEGKWRQFSNEYQRIKRQINKYLEGHIDNEKEAKVNLKRYLKHYFEDSDLTSSAKEIILKYKDEILEINSMHDWWIFAEVSKYFDYKIFMAEATEIGYKRTKRKDQERTNDLFQKEEENSIIIDTNNPKKILDYLRAKITWD